LVTPASSRKVPTVLLKGCETPHRAISSRPMPSVLSLEPAERLERLRSDLRMRAFLASGGRLVVATEGRGVEEIGALVRAGHRDFGEKYVQELARKAGVLCTLDPRLRLTLFGRLQRNKAGAALRLADRIESFDRPRLAHRLRFLADTGTRLPELLLQVNTGREPQKGGVLPEDADALIDLAQALGLPLCGVMGIPPRGEDPRPHFRFLRTLADRHHLPVRQMGMSDDWPEALDEGATAIRLGRAVFGASLHALR